MDQIIECVPNFSEGRDFQKINQILGVIERFPDLKILNCESDYDHNRTVITFIGKADAVIKAGFQVIKIASEIIDLNIHQGIHPRIGATDVFPIIPIKNCTVEQAVIYAHQLGKQVGTDLKIPVHLYELAAKSPEKQDLAYIRKHAPSLTPDYGPLQHPRAGATVIGVRNFLIAYNINLNTPDITIAKKIAKKIRTKNGGLPYLKAIGLYLNEKNSAQVSMNLTNFEVTNIDDAYEAVEKEAHKLGTTIKESELIGMLPAAALNPSVEKILTEKPSNFTKEKILKY